MFNIDNAKRRAAELGQLLGPILVRGCGPGGIEGEVYFTALTVGDNAKLQRLRETETSTYDYRELLLRAKDKDGDRIWQDDEIDDVLDGGIDPMDCAFIIGSMYAGDKYKRKPEGDTGPFDKAAARAAFEKLDATYGPIQVPNLGDEGADLDVWFKHNNGYRDCAIAAIRRKYPHEFQLRVLIDRALDKTGKPMFNSEHLPYLHQALTPKELDSVTIAMQSPRFMSDEERIRLRVAASLDPEPDLDDLKN